MIQSLPVFSASLVIIDEFISAMIPRPRQLFTTDLFQSAGLIGALVHCSISSGYGEIDTRNSNRG